jgi:multiple sugar transport system ATP-binding protein
MRKGELQQVAPPEELYDRPVNLFVGGFIGSPAMNIVEAELVQANGDMRLSLGEQSLALGSRALGERPALRDYAGRTVVVGIRPEHLHDASLDGGAPADRRLRGNVELREGLGSEIVVHVGVNARPAITEDVRELAADIGDDRTVTEAEPEQESTLVARFDAASDVKEGETIEVAVDTDALHFFDPETGLGIYDQQRKG